MNIQKKEILESFYDQEYFCILENRYWSHAHGERVRDIELAMEETCPSGNVLDFGSGSGFFSHLLLSKYDAKVFAWDYSLAAQRFMAEHYPSVQILRERDDIFSQKYSGVFCADVIEHIAYSAHDEFIKTFAQIIDQGGWLILSTDNEDSWFMKKWGRRIQKIDSYISSEGRSYVVIKEMERRRPYAKRYHNSHIGLLGRDALISVCEKDNQFRLVFEKHGFLYNSPLSKIVSFLFRLRPVHSVYVFRKT